MYGFPCSERVFRTGKHHHFPILDLFFLFPGYCHFHIRYFLRRRLRIFFRIRILLLFLTAIFFCMGLPFRIRQDDLSAHRIAVTRILWHNPVGCNISACLVRMVGASILFFNTFQGNILLFWIVMDAFHTSLCHKILVGNVFRDIFCCYPIFCSFWNFLCLFRFRYFCALRHWLWRIFGFCRMDIR